MIDNLIHTTDKVELNDIQLQNSSMNKSSNKNLKASDALNYWKSCLSIIKDNVNNQVFKTWFEPIKPLAWKQKKLTLMVPSQFFFEWIEEHYYDLMRKTIQKVLGSEAVLQYEIVMDEGDESKESKTVMVPAFRYPPSVNQSALPFNKGKVVTNNFNSFLNSRYVFDNFIVGDSNQLAYAAGMNVASKPGMQFNPLFIYGDTGLGKTHLVQAIGNKIINSNPHSKVLYTNSERFTQDFISSIQNNKTADFVNFYRSIDVLIVDDIQFFAGKEKTQDNFFHTFNALYQSGKQVILTSDKPPIKVKDIDERLISRFQSGLTVDIQSPDLEMRIAVLQKKSSNEGLDIPFELIEYLASSLTHSIRELEGALISLMAKVTLDKRVLSLDLAKEVVSSITHNDEKPLSVENIKEIVASYYNIPIDLIESKLRKQEITLARQMCMYLMKQFTTLSLKSIGAYFGGRDHSTVLHACRTIESHIFTDKNVKAAYEHFNGRISSKIS